MRPWDQAWGQADHGTSAATSSMGPGMGDATSSMGPGMGDQAWGQAGQAQLGRGQAQLGGGQADAPLREVREGSGRCAHELQTSQTS